MRQVKARAAGAKRPARGGGRAKPVARAPEARPELRVSRTRLAADTELSRFARLRASFLFRRPILALTGVLLVVGGIGGLVAGGYIDKAVAGVEDSTSSVLAQAGFTVRGIQITGNERTSAAAVRTALGFKEGQPIFAADPAGARARMMRLPWVSDAEIHRLLPGKLAIRLIEKRPFALWRTDKGFDVVERSGAVITGATPGEFGRLPILVGAGAPEAAAPLIDALAPDRAVNARLAAIERVGERRWDLILSGGVTVKLPEEGWEAQLSDLERLIVDKGVLERDIEMIDLRYPDHYVFRLHNGDSRPVPRDRRA